MTPPSKPAPTREEIEQWLTYHECEDELIPAICHAKDRAIIAHLREDVELRALVESPDFDYLERSSVYEALVDAQWHSGKSIPALLAAIREQEGR